MSKNQFVRAFLFAGWLAWRGTLTASELPAAVSIDETRALRPVSTRLFGFNHNWRWAQDYLKDANEFVAATKGLSLPLNRMSGTESQYFRWKYSIGPVSKRTPYPGHWEQKPSVKTVGVVEWISACLAADPQAVFTWTFNLLQEDPQDHADLVEFLTGDPARDPNGGTNWAALRVQCGLTRPVPVVIWELGNEVDHGQSQKQRFPDVNAYVSYCRRTIAAVRAVQPHARFAAAAATSPWSYEGRGDWRAWHRAILQGIGKDIDYLAFHPYYLGVAVSDMEKYLDTMSADIQAIVGQRKIKLYLSEHAMWPPNSDDPKSKFKFGHMTHALKGCLATAQFLNRMLQRPDVDDAAYHSIMGGPWNVIRRGEKTKKLYPTGIAELFRLLNDAAGNAVVRCAVTGEGCNPTKRDNTFTAGAMTTQNGLSLLLVNRDPDHERAVSFRFNNTYTLTKEAILTAPSLDSCNTETERPIARAERAVNIPQFTSYRIPAKAVVVLTLTRR